MDWVKLHTRFYVDPKVASLPDADTELMFLRGLAYAGDQETSGFIPESAVGLLARRRRHAACVKALVASGLWTTVPGGYRITRWDDRQEELETLARRRAADRERKRRQRASEKSSPQPMSRDTSADSPRDVRALEGEEETELPKGGMVTHDPPDRPPPRRCPAHQTVTGTVPPCGACADARHAHDTWQPPTTNSTRPPPACGAGCTNGWQPQPDGTVTRCTCNPDPLVALIQGTHQ